MYSRQMLKAPASIVTNGKAVFGTFEGTVPKLDIRGLRAPFGGVPLPAFISNFRIKSSLTLSFTTEQFMVCVTFFDAKIFGIAAVELWNTENGRKYTYKSLMGPRRRFIPHNLEQGFCASFNHNRYIRISWDHKRDRISVIFNIKGDSARPSVQAAFTGHFSDPDNAEVTQSVPVKSRRRVAASYFATPKVRGTLTLSSTKSTPGITVNAENAPSFFSINRAYYGYISQNQMVHACGMQNGKNVAFLLENSPEMAPDPEISNRNLMVVDGKCTPLPPVKMTQPMGLNGKWIIQDTENMVDLTLTPASLQVRELSVFVFRIRMYYLFCKIEGVLKTKDGEEININDIAGIARDQMFRV